MSTTSHVFKPGDTVRRMRNMNHPENREQWYDNYAGSWLSVRRTDIDELIGHAVAAEAVAGRYRRAVVVVEGVEYDAVTGKERGSGTTRIEVLRK